MLSLLSVITYLDGVCIAVAGPRMQDALHIRPEAWGWVTSVRFCFGAGEAGAYPNASAVIARWIPAPDARGLGGIVWMTSQVGAALSPLLVVPIQIRYGWRAPFFVFSLVGVMRSLAWYAWFRIRRMINPESPRPNFARSVPPPVCNGTGCHGPRRYPSLRCGA